MHIVTGTLCVLVGLALLAAAIKQAGGMTWKEAFRFIAEVLAAFAAVALVSLGASLLCR